PFPIGPRGCQTAHRLHSSCRQVARLVAALSFAKSKCMAKSWRKSRTGLGIINLAFTLSLVIWRTIAAIRTSATSVRFGLLIRSLVSRTRLVLGVKSRGFSWSSAKPVKRTYAAAAYLVREADGPP